MLLKKHRTLFYGITSAFILLNALFIVSEQYWFPAISVGILVVCLGLFSLDKLVMMTIFFTPLAIQIDDVGLGMGVSLPTEPLMAGVLLVFLFKQLYEGSYDLKVLKHPITLAILANLAWMGITTITSEMPGVSLKFFLSRLWFVVPFFFVGVLIFKQIANVRRFMWLYIIPLTGVMIYTVIRMAAMGFEKDFAHWVMQPFYSDHAVYATCIAIFIPFLLAYSTGKEYHINGRIIAGMFFVVFSVGMILSYTRASWVSLGVALGVWGLIRMKVPFKYVLLVGTLFIGSLLYFQEDIIMRLEKNKQDSSDDFAEHVESISNVATDASNLERLNRWSCALRMFGERPVFGWGPGTYMFQYAPFQHSTELTIISTNFGEVGNAHSEYLGPLAEQGVLGSLTFSLLVILIFYRGIKLYYRLNDPKLKMLVMSVILGLVTYLSHSFLNNFLDTDKASVPFWSFVAILVAIDIYHQPKETDS